MRNGFGRKLSGRTALSLVGLLLFVGGATWGWAQQETDPCQQKCREVVDLYRQQQKAPPPAGFMDECLRTCRNKVKTIGEAEISTHCKGNCERLLKQMNLPSGPTQLKQCVDECVRVTMEQLRKAKSGKASE
jgi:hypothetical protein